MNVLKSLFLLLLTTVLSAQALAWQGPPKAPERERGEGPYERLILRGGTVITGEGAPPQGPVDIVIENDRIVQITSVGNPGVPIKESRRPQAEQGDQEIDVTGHYIMPGFIDMHAHIGGSAKGIPAEYVLKLWLGHGITTIREPGSFNGLDWVQWHQTRAQDNAIASPRIVPYVGFGQGWDEPIYGAEQAREWVRYIKEQGAKGIKFFGASRKVMEAALDEANNVGLGTMMHHAQLNVMSMNALDSARLGLTSMEHWYGLPEALFEEQRIQDYPAHYNYNNEQHRFEEAGRLWQQAAERGSDKWTAVRDELIDLDFTINPTLTIYEASRDLMRERQAIWHDEYTLPRLWDFFEPSRYAHGSYWFDWTTDNEIAWKKNFRKWMDFLADYHAHGGRITLGSDAGYIYKIYGFGYIREMELLREAGLNALEVIHAATVAGSEALGMSDDIGSIALGKKADLVVVKENPLNNFKVLYGTGHFKLDGDNQPMRTNGIKYTIKDGIVYDAQQLLEDVKRLVDEEKASRQ